MAAARIFFRSAVIPDRMARAPRVAHPLRAGPGNEGGQSKGPVRDWVHEGTGVARGTGHPRTSEQETEPRVARPPMTPAQRHRSQPGCGTGSAHQGAREAARSRAQGGPHAQAQVRVTPCSGPPVLPLGWLRRGRRPDLAQALDGTVGELCKVRGFAASAAGWAVVFLSGLSGLCADWCYSPR